MKKRVTVDSLLAKAVSCAVSVVKFDRVQNGAATNRVRREISISVPALAMRLDVQFVLFSTFTEFANVIYKTKMSIVHIQCLLRIDGSISISVPALNGPLW